MPPLGESRDAFPFYLAYVVNLWRNRNRLGGWSIRFLVGIKTDIILGNDEPATPPVKVRVAWT